MSKTESNTGHYSVIHLFVNAWIIHEEVVEEEEEEKVAACLTLLFSLLLTDSLSLIFFPVSLSCVARSKAPSSATTGSTRTAPATCWETWKAACLCCCWRRRSWWTALWLSKTCTWNCLARSVLIFFFPAAIRSPSPPALVVSPRSLRFQFPSSVVASGRIGCSVVSYQEWS